MGKPGGWYCSECYAIDLALSEWVFLQLHVFNCIYVANIECSIFIFYYLFFIIISFFIYFSFFLISQNL